MWPHQPRVNVRATAIDCDTARVTFEVDWPIPYGTTTQVYAGDALVGEHEDGTDPVELFTASNLPRGITIWRLAAYSTKHGLEYVSDKTDPVAVDTRQVCPLPGDCVLPYDDAVSLFDVLRAIDVTLGNAEAGLGCDGDCSGGTD